MAELIQLRERAYRKENNIAPLLEAYLLGQDKPISIDMLSQKTGYYSNILLVALNQLEHELQDSNRGIMLAWNENDEVQLVPKPEYQVKIQEMQKGDIDKLMAVVNEFLYVLQSQGRRKKTLDNYRLNLSRFIKSIQKPVQEITTRDIRYYLMQEKERGNCRNTIASKTAILRSFFSWLEKEEIIEKDPTRKIKNPRTDNKAPKFLTHEEIEKVREAVETLIDRLLFEVLYSSGIRVSEAVKLNWQDIDFNNKTLYVRDGKGGKSRATFLSTKAVMLLKKYKETRTDNGEWVFQSQYKRRMSKESIERHIRQLGKKAGLNKRLTPHRLRHSLATHLLERDTPIDMVQKILGHSDVSTTQVYAKTNTANIEHHYRKLHP